MTVSDYFPEINAQQHKQFDMMGQLYNEWNSKINVISRKDIEFLYERHILHSLAIAKTIHFEDNACVLDVGTGGGFPGVPLAIYFPNAKFHLIDSIGKKLKVVDAVIEALQLKNVTTQNIRAENLNCKIDFAVSRAVTSLSTLSKWLKNKFLKNSRHSLPNGMLLLKGGDLTAELTDYRKKATIFDISTFYVEPFFKDKKVVHVASN